MNADRSISKPLTVTAAFASLAALLLAVAPAAAQGGGEQQGQGQMQQARQQLRQINQKLQKVRQQAMQDSALQAEQLALQEIIGQAARAQDPEFKKKENRLNEIQKQLQKAQQSQDTAKLRSLMMEGQKLQRDVRQTARQVSQRDSIDQKIQAFRDKVRQKMVEIDPQAEQLLERRDSLMNQLRQSSGRGQRGGGQQQGSGSGGGPGGGGR